MTFLERPVEWVGARGTAAAVACILGSAVLLTVAAATWDEAAGHAGSLAGCARQAGDAATCEAHGRGLAVLLGTLFGTVSALMGIALGSVGAACALRPRGRLGAHSQRLLDDATRHFASGGLSQEGFQATRDRLHAQSHARLVPQLALALSILGAALSALAFLLAGRLLALLDTVRGLPLGSLPALRTEVGLAGLAAAAALGGGILVLAQASRWRARARTEASALQQMLADLESDILDEVRRSGPALPADEPAAPEP